MFQDESSTMMMMEDDNNYGGGGGGGGGDISMVDEHNAIDNDDLAADLGAMMRDLAAVPGLADFIYRWLLALNEAFPEQTATWTLLHQDMEAVAQYCAQHYTSPAACLAQQPDELGALVVTQENNEFLPGLSAHDMFNHHSVSRATRQSMVSYTQCMFTLVSQWSGETLAAEYEAAAQQQEHREQQQQQFPQYQQHQQQRHPTQRYAALFNYMLERSARHQNVDTGVPAINAFFATATGQWASVLLVRHLCAVHTDVLCELFQFVEHSLHVDISDPAIWSPALVQVMARKLAGISASPTRRAAAWAWFERWLKWFDEGSPVAFVSREQYQRTGGRGILFPETLTSDVRAVLVSDTAATQLARMQLRHDDVVLFFDRVVEAYARGDEESVVSIISQFMQVPSVRSAARHCMHEWGIPPQMFAAAFGPDAGGGGGGEDAARPQGGGGGGGSGGGGDGRKAQRDAAMARCRQRAAQAAMAAGTLASAASLAPPPVMDTRSIDDLVAFIGAAPTSSASSTAGSAAAPKKNNHHKKKRP